MKLSPYPCYRPTGIDWLGDIAAHWDVRAIKHLVSTPVTDGPHSTPEILDEGIPFVSAEAINHGRINFGKIRGYITQEDHKLFSKKYKPARGDIYLVKSGATTGRVAMVETDIEFNIWSPLAAIRCNPALVDRYFLFFFLQSKEFQTAIELSWSFGTQQNIGMSVIQNLVVPIPSLSEQRAIAKFLKRETGRMDRLVAKKRELIERLKEKRAALISRTVTRGLPTNAARVYCLTENPCMRPSGFDWLGEIPNHWQLKKFGYISIVVRGASPRPAGDSRYFDGDFTPWITVGEVTKDEKIYLTTTETMLTEDGATNSRTIRSGTLVITNSGATLGVPKILLVTGCANDGIVAFESLTKDADKLFLYYFLRSLTENLRDRIKQGSGQPNLNTDIIKGLVVPFPPLPEQVAIASYLDKETSKLDSMIGKVQEAIERIQECRTALITAAVTGKIDVRKAAP